MMDPIVKQAAEKAGKNLTALAKALGVTRAALHQWRRVPAERVLELERVTGVSRHDIRPDIYPRDDAPPQSAEALP